VRAVSFFVLAAVLVVTAGTTVFPAQPPDKKGAGTKSLDVFRQFRNLMNEGRYDVAALVLDTFLKSLPADEKQADAVLQDIEDRYGTTVFQNLRNVPKWSDDPEVDKQARANVETLIAKAKAASDRKLKTEGRVTKFINNLGATPEERIFAENELRKAGNYAVPFMVEEFRLDRNPDVSNGIVRAIPNLESQTIGGWLAALEVLKPDQRYLVLKAITSRQDALLLHTSAQTDFVPDLWRIMAQTEGQQPEPATRTFARGVLTTLGLDPDRTDPRVALVANARRFYDRKAKFAGAKKNPDGTPDTVPVWVWDAMANKLIELPDVPVGQAEEYFGLRYARWALEKDPAYQPAQQLILALAAERAVERGKFGDLAKTDPAAYALLASAPSEVLQDLLDQALAQKRTALVLGLVQALGERGDKTAAGVPPAAGAPRPLRQSLFVRALDYPDPRVQLAAANALLRAPVVVDPTIRGRVVDVLRRAVAAEAGLPADAKGQALIADPNRQRADGTAVILRSMGYDVEIFTSGRDLLRRVAKSSDFDLILIDHHIVNPELQDVLGQLRADVRAGNRPVLVVASADKPRPPSLDSLLLRLALLIAATESDPVAMPPPFNPDPNAPYNVQTREVTEGMSAEQFAAARRTSGERRDNVFRTARRARVDRLLRVVDTSGLHLTPAQQAMLNLRAEQVTLAVLAAEYPISPESSPRTFEAFVTLNNQIAAQPPVPEYTGVGLDNLMMRVERLEQDVARVAPVQKRYDDFRARIDVEGLGLVVRSTRDLEAEVRATRLVRGFPGVRVIPEPYSRVGFENDLKVAFADDPAAAPRDQAEKHSGARLAVEWLRKMAVGEVPGFDVRPAEPELRAALGKPDLAEPAVDAVARLGSADAQQDLFRLALGGGPLPLRLKAADATIRHIQTFGRLVPQATVANAEMQIRNEPDLDLRGKLLQIKGLLSPNPTEYLNGLKQYQPPLVPVKEAAPAPPKQSDKEEKKP
jgi:CheY-like chemotaxis protein